MTDPVRPSTIPPDIAEAATQAFILTSGSDSERLLAAVAAALNLARDQIAQWISGKRSLTNAELTALRDAYDNMGDHAGDPGAVYLSYCARLVRVWPGGYRG